MYTRIQQTNYDFIILLLFKFLQSNAQLRDLYSMSNCASKRFSLQHTFIVTKNIFHSTTLCRYAKYDR
jgi:hypothetical protein